MDSISKKLTAALGNEKPSTAVTDWVERLCSNRYEEEDLDGVHELVESVQLQTTGPTEASRAIRKKLKYGSVHQQLRALTLLKALVENGGTRFQSASRSRSETDETATFSDERLVDRIKVMAGDPATSERVKKKLFSMVLSWHRQFKDDPRMSLIAGLHKSIRPGESTEEYRERVRRQEEASKLRQEKAALERAKLEAERDAERERKEAEKRRKKQKPGQRRPPFNFEAEKPKIMTAIAQLTQSSNALINTLQHIDRQKEQVDQNQSVLTAIEKIKRDRIVVVRYTQLIQNDPTGEYISSLLSTNELAIKALRLYDYYCQPVDHDSDDEHGKDATESVRRMALGPAGQVDRLQERQAIEVERAQAAQRNGQTLSPASAGDAFDDLADLDFSLPSDSGLQAPLQPGRADHEHYDPGTLSDFSDYDSEEERRQAASRSQQQAAFDSSDPFADPFDDSAGVSTPGITERKPWAVV